MNNSSEYTENTAHVQRTALRRMLMAQRYAMTRVDVIAQTAHIHQSLMEKLLTLPHNTVLALYAPHAGEPDVLCLAAHIATQHPQFTLVLPVVMPKVDGQNQALQFARWAVGEPLEADAYGIVVPVHKRWVKPTALVVPCVGYCYGYCADTKDIFAAVSALPAVPYRLGYGGGYYDRTLAALRANGKTVPAWGVAWEHARCVFEPSTFDVAMDAMLV